MELTIDQALQKGIEAHKAGEFQEADRYYTAILKENPKHPNANHGMGVLAASASRLEMALPYLKNALEANPSISQFWLSYIDALVKLDRISDAKAVFDQAKRNGAKGDAFDQIENRLGSSSSITLNSFNKSVVSLENHINNLYNRRHLEVLRIASMGWHYDLQFHQNFLATDEIQAYINHDFKSNEKAYFLMSNTRSKIKVTKYRCEIE